MKRLYGGLAVFCLTGIFSIAVFSQGHFKTNSFAQIAQSDIVLQPGEALIKKTEKKSAMNVLAIDYCPLKSGVLKVDVFDPKGELLASQTEKVKKINETATTCVYVDNSINTQTVTAVLNGAGFNNKQISYAES
jgi:hypothetical protein